MAGISHHVDRRVIALRKLQFCWTRGLLVAIMFVSVGCGSQTIVFDSGRGSDPLAKMTYVKYQSEILFTPEKNMLVSSIKLDTWYCNGTCGYTATIQDESQVYLASQTGSIDVGNTGDIHLPAHYLDSVVQMKAGTTYRIILEAWTTKSVGIYTTGDRTTGTIGQAHYSVVYARDVVDDIFTADLIDRGSISFQFWGWDLRGRHPDVEPYVGETQIEFRK